MSSPNDLENAIPPALRCPRTTPLSCPPNYTPPYESFSTRFADSVTDVAIAIIGVQSANTPSSTPAVVDQLKTIMSFLTSSPGTSPPSFWEPCSYTDATGAFNAALIAYWPSSASFQEWKEHSGFAAWWQDLDPTTSEMGYWMEAFCPSMDRLETVLSKSDIVEGMGHMGSEVSGAVREHGYWGGMRDRLPIAQRDELCGEQRSEGSGEGLVANGDTAKRRITVPGKKNLVVIRSGQDWSGTSPEEHKLYTETMHPVLVRGMDFLRDEGGSIGCYSCRFMECWGRETFAVEGTRTFGLAYFDEVASLERWTKSHKTHVDIFGRFMKYAKEMGGDMGLRLWHEVYVLEAQQQRFEYVGCHARTGMLAAL